MAHRNIPKRGIKKGIPQKGIPFWGESKKRKGEQYSSRIPAKKGIPLGIPFLGGLEKREMKKGMRNLANSFPKFIPSIPTGPMTSYVGLYQATLVPKIDRQMPC